MLTWEHRVVKNEEGILQVCEVYFDENDNLSGYCPTSLDSHSLIDLGVTISRINDAFEKPFIYHEEFFKHDKKSWLEGFVASDIKLDDL